MNPQEKITGIVLAGGKSSRMGTDKGLVILDGKAMIDHVLRVIRAVCDDVMIVAHHAGYEKFGYPVIGDRYKNSGPLGGIHAGLSHSNTPWNLVMACDLPLMTPEFLKFLISNIADHETIIPVHENRMEPMSGLYHQSSLKKIESLLLKSKLKMQEAVGFLDAKLVTVPEIFDSKQLFKNMNTPQDIFSVR